MNEIKKENERNSQVQSGIDFENFAPSHFDPEGKSIKAHFYVPEKPLFGTSYNTLLINTVVIWVMTFFYLLFYISGF